MARSKRTPGSRGCRAHSCRQRRSTAPRCSPTWSPGLHTRTHPDSTGSPPLRLVNTLGIDIAMVIMMLVGITTPIITAATALTDCPKLCRPNPPNDHHGDLLRPSAEQRADRCRPRHPPDVAQLRAYAAILCFSAAVPAAVATTGRCRGGHLYSYGTYVLRAV
jgi:hypothetical protein